MRSAAFATWERAATVSSWHSWTFFTTHAHVLLVLARRPDARVAELAEAVELSERAVYRIVGDLRRAGYVRREKVGRRNRYVVDERLPIDGGGGGRLLLGDLLALLGDGDPEATSRGVRRPARPQPVT